MKTFTILSSNPNSNTDKPGFVTKLQAKTIISTPFGDKDKVETYYVSGPKQMTKDSTISVDMSMFIIQEYPMVNPSTGETFQGKWLHCA